MAPQPIPVCSLQVAGFRPAVGGGGGDATKSDYQVLLPGKLRGGPDGGQEEVLGWVTWPLKGDRRWVDSAGRWGS